MTNSSSCHLEGMMGKVKGRNCPSWVDKGDFIIFQLIMLVTVLTKTPGTKVFATKIRFKKFYFGVENYIHYL